MFDYAIIGGGVVGSAIFNKLTRKGKKCVLLEKELDLGEGATKANSGLVHAGFDAESGTLKAKFNKRGNEMIKTLARELRIAYNQTGALVVGNDIEKLKNLKLRGKNNGIKGLKIIKDEELFRLVPNLSKDIKYALHAKTAGVISPFMLNIALAEEAVLNGGEFRLGFELKYAIYEKKHYTLYSENNSVCAKNVINCAGSCFNEVSKILGVEQKELQFRRGEYIVLDKCDFVNLTVFPLPTLLGKGILATPTIDGNILLGPTAEDVQDYDTSTTQEGIDKILNHIKSYFTNVPLYKNIRQFSGIRVSAGKDFVVEKSKINNRVVLVAGINSPGLTSAPAIAEYVAEELYGEVQPDKEMQRRKPYTSREKGKIVCRCEHIGENEIINAINAPIPAQTVDAIKRRTRAGFGRCQGGQCLLDVTRLIAKYQGVQMHEVCKSSKNSFICFEGGNYEN